MADFSITEAAFSGLRALRAKPVRLLVWWVVSLVMTAGALAVFAAVAGSAMADLEAIRAAGADADPTAALGATGKLLSGVAMMMPVYLILGAVLTAAACRAILRPDEGGPGNLSFGGDEFRLIVLLLVVGVIFFVIYVIGAMIGGIAAALSSGVARGQVPDPVKMQQTVLLFMTPFFLLMVFLGVKFSLAPAQTVATRAINIFGSFGLTKGRFWKVLGTLLLAGVVYAVVYLVAAALVYAVWLSMGRGGDGFQTVFRPTMTSVAELFTPAMIVYFLLMSLAGAISLALTVCPAADIYRQITAGDAEEAF